jgi:glutamine synthetase adenylyltransferase
MKTTNLSTIIHQLSLLALHLEVQRKNPRPYTIPSLRADLEALVLALQALYPQTSTSSEPPSSLLVLQRCLFAGALRAKEFRQLQQAHLSLQGAPSPEDLSTHTQRVQEIIQSFVPEEPSVAWSKYSPEVLCLLGPQDEVEKATSLASLGITGASAFLPRLDLLPKEECSARWLPAISESPDPERSLRWLLSLLEAPFGLSYYRFFSRHEAWVLALLRIVGVSEWLSRLSLQNLDLAASVFVQPSLGETKTPELSIAALRSWQRQEQLRIMLAWSLRGLTLYEAQRQLSLLAEACVVRCFDQALAEDRAHHLGAAPRLGVIALGSLGSFEMLYQSDVDLLFLWDGDTATQERCTRVAQRTIALLTARHDEGSLYEVDTRLRPLGTQGPLVVSVQGWSRYFGLTQSDGPRGHLWEEQALLRARTLAGDAELLAVFSGLQRRVLTRPRVAQIVIAELRQMRQRIEDQVPKHSRFYYKASSGGLQDIEFLVQCVQLTHGDKIPDLLCAATHQGLTLLSGAGLLSTEDTSLLLSAHERWLTLLLLSRLLAEKNLDFVPENSDALRRALGELKISSEESFQKQLELLRVQVRACFDRVVH